ncbi:ribonuclease R [Candidatus Gracilibacteria bacterium]|nr:ribonuclease R [Candidatus Gracilibacteria bacterium]
MQKKRGFYNKSIVSPKVETKNILNKDELVGVYKQMEGGFGFVDVVDKTTGKKEGYYVHETKKLDALEGDEVAFVVNIFKGKSEAHITRVVSRSEHLIVGTLRITRGFGFLIADNRKISKDIFIPGKFIGGYTDGSRVAVQVIKWEGKNPEGRIMESLSGLPKGREDIYTVAFEMGARKTFSEKLMQEVSVLQSPDSGGSRLKIRTDLKHCLTYTIDGAESKDLDDALSIEKTDNGYRLYVHIADVAHYVKENSALDREARKRATSIYLIDQVIPMLPPEISNGLCSLHPGESKLTMTCEMELDMKGNIQSSKVYESVIESDYRLTYKEIDEIVSGSISLGDSLQFGNELSGELQKNIFLLKEFSGFLEKKAISRGSLDFDFPETKIILDDTGKPIEYRQYERYDSYKLIEVCMVLANETIAKLFSKIPFLYRVHEEPDEEDIEKFLKLLERLGVNIGKQLSGIHITPLDIQSTLSYLQFDPKLSGFQKIVLRSMAKARYSEKNFGHFGLALTHYSHFTSPIRRYADLQIHRIIKESLDKKYSHERKLYYKEVLPKVARICSEKTDKAEKMEYKVRDMLACKYMSDKIGKVYKGKISGIIDKGFFVELENTIEGFIDTARTFYTPMRDEYRIVNEQTGVGLQFGDAILVELISVDMEKMRIEFTLK